MIKKFQQGGKQEDAVMQFVKGIADTLQADPQQVIQAAQQNPDALKAAVQVYQETQDIQKAAQTFAQAIQGKAKKAEHGAKLEYVKGLKKTCAKDEELVYFKNGGKAGCGCKKKVKPVKKAKCGTAVEKFKKMQQGGIAPKSKDRYKNGKKDSYANGYEHVDVVIGQKPNFYIQAPTISRTISSDGNDTTFVEVPEHSSFVTTKPRIVKNNWIQDESRQIINGKYPKIYNNSPEYYIMKRRFSEAQLATPGEFKHFTPSSYQRIRDFRK